MILWRNGGIVSKKPGKPNKLGRGFQIGKSWSPTEVFCSNKQGDFNGDFTLYAGGGWAVDFVIDPKMIYEL